MYQTRRKNIICFHPFSALPSSLIFIFTLSFCWKNRNPPLLWVPLLFCQQETYQVSEQSSGTSLKGKCPSNDSRRDAQEKGMIFLLLLKGREKSRKNLIALYPVQEEGCGGVGKERTWFFSAVLLSPEQCEYSKHQTFLCQFLSSLLTVIIPEAQRYFFLCWVCVRARCSTLRGNCRCMPELHICHEHWKSITALGREKNLVLITDNYR